MNKSDKHEILAGVWLAAGLATDSSFPKLVCIVLGLWHGFFMLVSKP